MQSDRQYRPWAAIILVFVWMTVGLSGLWALGAYASRGQIPVKSSPAIANEDRGTLLLFAHPHCPCFTTSLSVFADIVAQAGTHLRSEIVFVRPDGAPADWERTASWRAALALDGIRVSCDEGGERAKRYGANTSGEVIYIDNAGEVRFRGGITRPGNHPGGNLGKNRLLAILKGQDVPESESPVYGCLLN